MERIGPISEIQVAMQQPGPTVFTIFQDTCNNFNVTLANDFLKF